VVGMLGYSGVQGWSWWQVVAVSGQAKDLKKSGLNFSVVAETRFHDLGINEG